MSQINNDNRIKLIAGHIEEIIRLIGEDTTRPGLAKTPYRAAKALCKLTEGYHTDAEQIVGDALFAHDGSRIVLIKDIEFYSLCEHHILPFFGRMSIAYIPDGRIIGLSKVARLVNLYARRLQVQERLTAEVCQAVAKATGARGVIACCNAQHLCMKMRGVEKQDSSTSTLDFCGIFADDASLREQFFNMI